jgi:4-carboxymuconolactone decarboxylase
MKRAKTKPARPAKAKGKPKATRRAPKLRVTAPREPRFPELSLEQMTEEQRRVAEEIKAGPRGGLRGPFNAWLRSPAAADRLQKVGEFVRFHSSLEPRLNELAILITARTWTAQFEWWAHRRLALNAGLSPKIADAIAAGRRPRGMAKDESIVYDFSTELLRDKNVSDKTFKATVDEFGEHGVIDLIAAHGYYGAVSMTLNVAEVALPEGEKLLPKLSARR